MRAACNGRAVHGSLRFPCWHCGTSQFSITLLSVCPLLKLSVCEKHRGGTPVACVWASVHLVHMYARVLANPSLSCTPCAPHASVLWYMLHPRACNGSAGSHIAFTRKARCVSQCAPVFLSHAALRRPPQRVCSPLQAAQLPPRRCCVTRFNVPLHRLARRTPPWRTPCAFTGVSSTQPLASHKQLKTSSGSPSRWAATCRCVKKTNLTRMLVPLALCNCQRCHTQSAYTATSQTRLRL